VLTGEEVVQHSADPPHVQRAFDDESPVPRRSADDGLGAHNGIAAIEAQRGKQRHARWRHR
jgi:hypothetical protein